MIEQLPLNFLPRRQIQPRRQGERNIDKEPGLALFGADHLNFHPLFGLHVLRLLDHVKVKSAVNRDLPMSLPNFSGQAELLSTAAVSASLFAEDDRYRLFAKLVYPRLTASHTA